jgi:hypothetical protein
MYVYIVAVTGPKCLRRSFAKFTNNPDENTKAPPGHSVGTYGRSLDAVGPHVWAIHDEYVVLDPPHLRKKTKATSWQQMGFATHYHNANYKEGKTCFQKLMDRHFRSINNHRRRQEEAELHQKRRQQEAVALLNQQQRQQQQQQNSEEEVTPPNTTITEEQVEPKKE